jgi:hypothetical protein
MCTHIGATFESVEGDGMSIRCDASVLGNGLLKWRLASIMMIVDLHNFGVLDCVVRRMTECAMFV